MNVQRQSLAYWIALARSLFAMALGVAIVLNPAASRSLLTNFVGIFWIAGSLMTIRWGMAGEKGKTLTIVVGVVGVLAGVTAVGSRLIGSRELLDALLGTVALLTGILHVAGLLHVRQRGLGEEKRTAVLLGGFEIGLGLVLLLRPYEQRLFVHWVAAGWAFVGGVTIFLDAMALRRKMLAQQEATQEHLASQEDQRQG